MITLEIRPAEGGKDAQDFAQDLMNAYKNFAARQG